MLNLFQDNRKQIVTITRKHFFHQFGKHQEI